MATESHAQREKTKVVVVPIEDFLEDGLRVFDVGGERLGSVGRYSMSAGYLKVKRDPIFPQDLYVPFRLIKTIDSRELFLKVPRETLLAHYTLPPKITVTAEHVEVDGRDGTSSVHTVEQRRVQSGYDRSEVTLDTIDLDEIAYRLAIGMAVYDADSKRVGELTQYDATRAMMVVEHGLKPRGWFIPFSAIAFVDTNDMFVALLVPKAILEKEYAAVPRPDEDASSSVTADPTAV